MLKYVGELNRTLRAEGKAPLDIGIGLHAGEAVIGHVGASTRHDYTAIGDVTNVASRLESLTKEAGYRVVCSRAVFSALEDREALVALGPMSIKGHTPVEVYGYDKI
jgi:adenylate cyclase